MASLYSNILVKNADYFIPCRTDPSREVYSKQNEEKAYSLQSEIFTDTDPFWKFISPCH